MLLFFHCCAYLYIYKMERVQHVILSWYIEEHRMTGNPCESLRIDLPTSQEPGQNRVQALQIWKGMRPLSQAVPWLCLMSPQYRMQRNGQSIKSSRLRTQSGSLLPVSWTPVGQAGSSVQGPDDNPPAAGLRLADTPWHHGHSMKKAKCDGWEKTV